MPQFVMHQATGRIYPATEALVARGDMRLLDGDPFKGLAKDDRSGIRERQRRVQEMRETMARNANAKPGPAEEDEKPKAPRGRPRKTEAAKATAPAEAPAPQTPGPAPEQQLETTDDEPKTADDINNVLAQLNGGAQE